MANVYLNTGTLSLYSSADGSTWTAVSGSSPYTLAVDTYYKLTAAPPSGKILSKWTLTDNIDNIISLSSAYTPEVTFNTNDQTWSYSENKTITITAVYVDEDNEFLNKRGLKDVIDRVAKIEYKEEIDHNLRNNTINLYDKYTNDYDDARVRYLLEHPEMMLNSVMVNDPSGQGISQDVTWTQWIDYVAENFSFDSQYDRENVVESWIREQPFNFWVKVMSMLNEKEYNPDLTPSIDLTLNIDNQNYNFNYILQAQNDANYSSFYLNFLFLLPFNNTWRLYYAALAEEDDGGIYIRINDEEELPEQLSSRMTYIQGHSSNFSNGLLTWEEYVLAYPCINYWCTAHVAPATTFKDMIEANNNQMPFMNPTMNYTYNNRNLNWIYDIHNVGDGYQAISGIFFIGDKIYLGTKNWIMPITKSFMKDIIIFNKDGKQKQYQWLTKEEDKNNLKTVYWGWPGNNWTDGTINIDIDENNLIDIAAFSNKIYLDCNEYPTDHENYHKAENLEYILFGESSWSLESWFNQKSYDYFAACVPTGSFTYDPTTKRMVPYLDGEINASWVTGVSTNDSGHTVLAFRLVSKNLKYLYTGTITLHPNQQSNDGPFVAVEVNTSPLDCYATLRDQNHNYEFKIAPLEIVSELVQKVNPLTAEEVETIWYDGTYSQMLGGEY